MERLLKPDEAGAIIGVSPKTLAGWRIAGTGPPWFRAEIRAENLSSVSRNYLPNGFNGLSTRNYRGLLAFLVCIKVCKQPILQRGMQNTYEIHGDVTVIHLRRRAGADLEALIDTADLALVDAYPGRFYAMWSEDSKTFYCIGHKRGIKSALLHRLVMGATGMDEVDHLDHYGLDNRRASLKIVTRSENALNRKGARAGSKSGVRGVYWHAKSGGWRAQVRSVDGKRAELPGSFATVAEAAQAREKWKLAS